MNEVVQEVGMMPACWFKTVTASLTGFSDFSSVAPEKQVFVCAMEGCGQQREALAQRRTMFRFEEQNT